MMLVIDSVINLLFIYLFSACSSHILNVLVSLVEITVNLLFTTIGVDAAMPKNKHFQLLMPLCTVTHCWHTYYCVKSFY